RFKSDNSARFGSESGAGGPWQSRGKPAVDAGATATMYMSAAAVFMLGLSYASMTGTASNPLLARVDNIERVREMRPVADCPLVVSTLSPTRTRSWLGISGRSSRGFSWCPARLCWCFYTARNPTDVPRDRHRHLHRQPLPGLPQYFNKIQCFCFEEQRLNPGEEVDMPVFFYIDPEFINDPRLRDVRQITLSYCFFEAKEGLSLSLPGLAASPAALELISFTVLGSSRSAKPDYQELMEQQLDDLRFHESRAELHRSVLWKFLGDSLAETVAVARHPCLSSIAWCDWRLEQGFDTLDVAHKQASKAASAQRQIEKDSLEAKKFQAAAETLEANLQSLRFADNLTHEKPDPLTCSAIPGHFCCHHEQPPPRRTSALIVGSSLAVSVLWPLPLSRLTPRHRRVLQKTRRPDAAAVCRDTTSTAKQPSEPAVCPPAPAADAPAASAGARTEQRQLALCMRDPSGAAMSSRAALRGR
uniref:Cytochrome c oxidase assembly protein CtaG / Cox11 family n=1 Tax=Macrostomum lignano TaxID=282301 RepID=A0A1I8F4S2_9PLAT